MWLNFDVSEAFFRLFCAIVWLKQSGVLPGLCFARKIINRDEVITVTLPVSSTIYFRERLFTKQSVLKNASPANHFHI
jgi:ribonucleotide reductase beta subunit family protein with ferritin-like domain